ncbi:hypothetical protein BGZ63DRAFT_128659 [Mariannaea sp. PMI_226]|nr:hypothetical protein BGZ63DRAFT_128659 [Mariannaea sp. PMI_226]
MSSTSDQPKTKKIRFTVKTRPEVLKNMQRSKSKSCDDSDEMTSPKTPIQSKSDKPETAERNSDPFKIGDELDNFNATARTMFENSLRRGVKQATKDAVATYEKQIDILKQNQVNRAADMAKHDERMKEAIRDLSDTFYEKYNELTDIFDKKVREMTDTFDEKAGQLNRTFDEKAVQLNRTFNEKVQGLIDTIDKKFEEVENTPEELDNRRKKRKRAE